MPAAQPARSELRAIKIVWRRELIRFRNDRMRIVTALIQPLLFLFVLGCGPAAARPAPAHGDVDLRTFIYPGILCTRGDVHGDVLSGARSSGTASSASCAMMVAPGPAQLDRDRQVPRRRDGREPAGRDPARARAGLRRRALQPGADPRHPRPACCCCAFSDHRVRRDGRRAHQADAVASWA